MRSILGSLFEQNDFTEQDLSWLSVDTKTYINKKSETYILFFVDSIENELYDKVFNLCSEGIYITDRLTQAQKSNLSIIIVSKVNDKLTDSQKNIIYKIEENDLYYKKFFLWYSEEELASLDTLVSNNYNIKILNQMLINKELFDDFKKNQEENKGYALLTRIYIKAPFLTLNELDTLDKTLSEYIQEALEEINVELFEFIRSGSEDGNLVFKSLDLIDLSEDEMSIIESEIRELVGTYGA